MSVDPTVRVALDLGAATASAALIGPIDGRRRLLGSVVLPAGLDDDALVAHLVDRVATADPALATQLGLGPSSSDDIPRLVTRSTTPPVLAVLATTARARLAVEAAASTAGWRTRGASLDVDGPVELTRIALGPDVATIAVAGVAATSREETATLGQLGAIVAGIAARPVAPSIVYVGEMARDDLEPAGSAETDDGAVFAPGPEVGEPEGEPLRDLLDRLDPSGPNPRRAALEALLDLAVVLDRRIELVEVGFDGGLRAVAGPGGLEVPAAFVPIAGLVPTDLDDDAVDESWPGRRSPSTGTGCAIGSASCGCRRGSRRTATAPDSGPRRPARRSARLVRATPGIEALSAPDLIVVAGGAWAAAPGPAICLAIADVVRRPGASQLAFDHARLLGPLGTIADPVERRALIGELADDLLAPLGSIIVPQGLRPAGPPAG